MSPDGSGSGHVAPLATGPAFADCDPQGLFCHLHQPLDFRPDLADRHRNRRIAAVSIQSNTAIDANDVPFLQKADSRNAVHDLFVSFYASVPAELGGSEERARRHFSRAVELSKGLSLGPYLSLASSVSVKNQDLEEFRRLLGTALAIDVNADPSGRLQNVISQRKARWLLDHVGETDKAKKVRDAVAAVVKEGKVRTYDMMKLTGGADVIAKGAATTKQMTDAIIAKL